MLRSRGGELAEKNETNSRNSDVCGPLHDWRGSGLRDRGFGV